MKPFINKILHSKRLTLLLSIVLLLSMLSSVLVIALEAEHDCTGHDCPICECIHQCSSFLSQLSGGLPIVYCVVFTILYTVFKTKSCIKIFGTATLITQKVRLND